jgi:hypothetical protein
MHTDAGTAPTGTGASAGSDPESISWGSVGESIRKRWGSLAIRSTCVSWKLLKRPHRWACGFGHLVGLVVTSGPLCCGITVLWDNCAMG